MRGVVGVGFRYPLGSWIESHPGEIECLEITAEHFFDAGEKRLRALREKMPLYVHGLGLSLGTPGPLDRETLDNFVRVVAIADPEWISEHVAFTRSNEVDLGHLNPVRPDRETLKRIADHVREVSERCGKPMIVENITSHVRLRGEMSEPEFLNELCAAAGCGLLLDVTNLYVNARNHRFDARAWLREIEPGNIVQLHVVGYSVRDGRYEDFHAEPIQPDLRGLIRDVLATAPVRAVIVERDSHFPPAVEFAAELRSLEHDWERNGSHDGTGAAAE